MITNVLKYIGVICAALVIGYIVGVRDCSTRTVQQTVSSSSEVRETEKSTSTTETTERPDGSKTTRTVTDTTRVIQRDDKKEIPVQKRPSQFRTTVAVRPEISDGTIKGHPVVGVGKRLWDSPAWADVIVDIDRQEVAVGVSLEW